MTPDEKLKEIEEQGFWKLIDIGYNNLADTADKFDWLIARVKRITDTLKWIMPKVHQGNHEGEFESCQKATCVEYRAALEDSDGA